MRSPSKRGEQNQPRRVEHATPSAGRFATSVSVPNFDDGIGMGSRDVARLQGNGRPYAG